MLAGKNHVMRLSLAFVLVAVCAVATAFAGQGTASASSPKGVKIGAHQVTRRPVGPNNSVPNTGTPNGIGPNTAPTCVGGDADASTAGCSQNAGIALPLTGTLNASVGDAVVNGGGSVDLAIGGQSVGFTLPATIVDTRGGAALWALSATSAGITLANAGMGPALNGAITLSGVAGACSIPTPPATANCTLGNGSVSAVTGSPTLGTTGTTFATAPTTGDFGTTIVTTTGQINIPAGVLGGSYSGTITVTATPAIPVVGP